MRYMIHVVPSRLWYVEEFLIPSMKAQGITDDEIHIWNDTEGKGNLYSCMDSFLYCRDNPKEGTWHIQDDVIIARNFAEMTKACNSGIVCGFVHPKWGPNKNLSGLVWPYDIWYSFQCIRIPDYIAGKCADWFYSVASKSENPRYKSRIEKRKHDDDFFRYYIVEHQKNTKVLNLKPNLVDHIDYLIGGTLINQNRTEKINRAAFFPDGDLVKQLEKELKEREIRNENSESDKT